MPKAEPCGASATLHDRDAKFCARFRSILQDGGVEPLRLSPSSPDLKMRSRNVGCARLGSRAGSAWIGKTVFVLSSRQSLLFRDRVKALEETNTHGKHHQCQG